MSPRGQWRLVILSYICLVKLPWHPLLGLSVCLKPLMNYIIFGLVEPCLVVGALWSICYSFHCENQHIPQTHAKVTLDGQHQSHLKNASPLHMLHVNKSSMPRGSSASWLAELHITERLHMVFCSHPTSVKLVNGFLCSSMLRFAISLALTSAIIPCRNPTFLWPSLSQRGSLGFGDLKTSRLNYKEITMMEIMLITTV